MRGEGFGPPCGVDFRRDSTLMSKRISQATLGGHLAICRFDHWFKNVFVLPGIVAALAIDPATHHWDVLPRALIGLLSIGLIASSNYTLNEILDAPHDLHHPEKQNRPVPSGRVSIPLAWIQWILLMVLGLGLGWLISPTYVWVMLALWVMGCVYNIPPVRTKEVAFLDVISESVNNPIRMMAGWAIAGSLLMAPTSLLLSYWAFGCFFMVLKRYAEYRSIGDPELAATYRSSFSYYTENRMLSSAIVYISAANLLFGAFLMRYHLELVLSFPMIAWVVGEYFRMALWPDSPVQSPEHLYRQKRLMLALAVCAVTIGVLLFVDMPWLHDIFLPTAF